MKASGARGSGLHAMTEKVREPPEHGGGSLGGHPVDCRKGRFHRLLPPTLQRFGALGGGLSVSVRNCWAYSALSRCQPRLHGLAADDGSSAEKAIQHVERNVPTRGTPRDEVAIDVVPQRQARAVTKGFEFPPEIVVPQCAQAP